MDSIPGTTLRGIRKSPGGYWMQIMAPSAGMTIDTTANTYDPGCICQNYGDSSISINIGTRALPVWAQTNSSAAADAKMMKYIEVDLAPADIIATTAGSLSHANGLIVVPAAPTGYVNVFARAIVSYTFGTAAYTGGGNTTFAIGAGGASITGLIATTTLWQNASSIIQMFVPLSTVAFPITKETSINLKTASAITNPGTAAGTAKVYCWYSQVAI